MNHPKFVVKKSTMRFFFHLTGQNGDVILNSEIHSRQVVAEEGVAAVRVNASIDDRYDRRKSPQGQHYFVLRDASGAVLGTSEMYASEAAMEKAVAAVKNHASVASVEVLS
jgi:uncharacterized protein YegP (UPF0339 family)